MNRMKVGLLAAMLFSAGVANAFIYANDNTLNWTGASSSDWGTVGNWERVQGSNPLRVPVLGDYVTVDSGTANITSAAGTVSRAYIGGTGGATVGIGADAEFERFYLAWTAGETGTANVSAGTLNVTVAAEFNIGVHGKGVMNISGGTVAANNYVRLGRFDGGGVADTVRGTVDMSGGTFNSQRFQIGFNANADGSLLEIEDATFSASAYIQMVDGQSDINVKGSGSTIDTDRLAINSGKGHALNLFLDAGGISTINVNGEAGATYVDALLTDLAITVSDLGTANVSFGDTFDVIRSDNLITESGLSVSGTVDGQTFDWNIVSEGGDQILRLTAIPEPATLGIVVFAGGALLWTRRMFTI